jgi:hypothetical protein
VDDRARDEAAVVTRLCATFPQVPRDRIEEKVERCSRLVGGLGPAWQRMLLVEYVARHELWSEGGR